MGSIGPAGGGGRRRPEGGARPPPRRPDGGVRVVPPRAAPRNRGARRAIGPTPCLDRPRLTGEGVLDAPVPPGPRGALRGRGAAGPRELGRPHGRRSHGTSLRAGPATAPRRGRREIRGPRPRPLLSRGHG